MVSIANYIARTAGEPFVWGRTDCALWAAQLAAERGGVDPAASLRGTYATAWECRQIVLRAGGLLTLCRGLMAGFPAGERKNGICVARHDGRSICGILSGGRLVLKTDGGIISPEKFTILEGWSV